MKKIRNISWIVFFLSITIFLVNQLLVNPETPTASTTHVSEPTYPGVEPGKTPPPSDVPSPSNPTGNIFVEITTLLTSVSSFLVAIITSVANYQRNKVDILKSQLELEKMRIELQEMKRKALDEEKKGK